MKAPLSAMRTPRVHLSIDRLVLRGFSPYHSRAIASGLRAELARLFADPRILEGLGESRDLASLDTGHPFHIAPAMTPRQIGATSASRIVAGLRP